MPFPSSSLWNTDISTAPVDSNSANIINYIGSKVTLHPDFGSGTYANQTNSDLPTGPAPVISSFTASSTSVVAGTSVTLNWATSGAIYSAISPTVGPVRGSAVAFNPESTATYTLYPTNRYGRTTASVTVTVH